ncbi:MAG: LysR family transcriptional regulator, partial [Spirochaetaceae bacterium]|nr:LysR family transcriptional regulator [Spirochaetaceae bacterium]
LDSYKIFCAVIKNGSMSAAAKELFITQPAVSMAVKQLEEKLGKPLLVRSQKGITATAEGFIMYGYLNQAFGLINTAEKKYSEMAGLMTGEIRIGAGDTIMRHFLLPYIEKYLINHPGINFKITNRTTFGTVKLLKNAQIDIGFVNLPLENSDGLNVIECLTVNDCVVGGKKYEWLRGTKISFDDLKKYPLMLLEKDSNSRAAQDRFAAANGHILSPALELGSSDLLADCVKINLGLGIVTKEFTDIDGSSMFELPFYPEFPESFNALSGSLWLPADFRLPRRLFRLQGPSRPRCVSRLRF